MLDRGIADLKQFADPSETDPSSRVEHVPPLSASSAPMTSVVSRADCDAGRNRTVPTSCVGHFAPRERAIEDDLASENVRSWWKETCWR